MCYSTVITLSIHCVMHRSLTYSHNEFLKSTENFIYPESYYRPLGERLPSLEGEERLRKRSDTYSVPPDPFHVLGHNRMFLSGTYT